MDLLPTLTNNLVQLRPLMSKDFKDLYAIASDPEIWEQHPVKERAELYGFIKFFAESLKSKGALLIRDQSTGKAIGSSRFKLRPEFGNAVEIGWTFLSKQYWGGFYNGALKKLMISYALNHVSEVLLFVDKDNFRSQKAIEKLDFIPEHQLLVDRSLSRRQNDIIYRILSMDSNQKHI